MRLVEWRRQEGLTQAALADLLGCDQSFVSQMERASDPQMPRSRAMWLRIYRVTGGLVMPNDWFDFQALDQPALPLPDAAEPELDLEEAA